MDCKTEDAEKWRADLLEKARKKQQCEERAHKIVLKLVENTVNEDYLVDAVKFLTPVHYADIVEERAIAKQCGYPICHNALGNVPQQKYHISTKTNKVYDITERKSFCSNQCYKASKFLQNQIPSSPVWVREEEPPPNIQLLDSDMNRGSVGEEVIQDRVEELRDEMNAVPVMDDKDSHRQNTSKQVAFVDEVRETDMDDGDVNVRTYKPENSEEEEDHTLAPQQKDEPPQIFEEENLAIDDSVNSHSEEPQEFERQERDGSQQVLNECESFSTTTEILDTGVKSEKEVPNSQETEQERIELEEPVSHSEALKEEQSEDSTMVREGKLLTSKELDEKRKRVQEKLRDQLEKYKVDSPKVNTHGSEEHSVVDKRKELKEAIRKNNPATKKDSPTEVMEKKVNELRMLAKEPEPQIISHRGKDENIVMSAVGGKSDLLRSLINRRDSLLSELGKAGEQRVKTKPVVMGIENENENKDEDERNEGHTDSGHDHSVFFTEISENHTSSKDTKYSTDNITSAQGNENIHHLESHEPSSTCSVGSSSPSGKKRLKRKKQKIPKTLSLDAVKGSLYEWKTPQTVTFLAVNSIQLEPSARDSEEMQKSQDSLENGLKETEENKVELQQRLAYNPDREQLKSDTELFDLRVKEFYKGSGKYPQRASIPGTGSNTKEDYDKRLAVAIDTMTKALATIKPADITCIKSLNCPPVGIKLVMEAVCILMGIEPVKRAGPHGKIDDYWGPSKRLLGDMMCFLNLVKNFDKDNIPAAAMKKIRECYITNPDFSPEVLKNVSVACVGLGNWVRALEMYDWAVKAAAYHCGSQDVRGLGQDHQTDKLTAGSPEKEVVIPNKSHQNGSKQELHDRMAKPRIQPVWQEVASPIQDCQNTMEKELGDRLAKLGLKISPKEENYNKILAVVTEIITSSQATFTKGDLTEIKSLLKPPRGVRLVMEAVCILMGVKPDRVCGKDGKIIQDFWAASKKLLGDMCFFLSLVKNFDKDNIPVAAMKKIRDCYITNPDFSPEALKNVSAACVGLGNWVRALEMYDWAVKAAAYHCGSQDVRGLGQDHQTDKLTAGSPEKEVVIPNKSHQNGSKQEFHDRMSKPRIQPVRQEVASPIQDWQNTVEKELGDRVAKLGLKIAPKEENYNKILAVVTEIISSSQAAIKKSDLTEIKALANPPKGVKLVMEAVCVLMGVKPDRVCGKDGKIIQDFWAASKKLIGNADFFQALMDCDKDDIPAATMKKIRNHYIPNPDFAPRRLEIVSLACVSLCKWIRALEMHDWMLKVASQHRGSGNTSKSKARELKEETVQAAEEEAHVKGAGVEESGPSCVPIMPLVDSQSQMALRRRIVLDKLNKVFPDLLTPVGLSVREISSDLRALVKTFRLGSQNILLKPVEWTLMAYILLKLLSMTVEAVQGNLQDARTRHYFHSMIMSMGVTETQIEAIVSHMTTADDTP